jgi:hypothetical protein
MGLLDRNGDLVLNNGRVRNCNVWGRTGIIRWFNRQEQWYFLGDDGSSTGVPFALASNKEFGIEKIADDGKVREYSDPFVKKAGKTYWCYVCRKAINKRERYLKRERDLKYHSDTCRKGG